MMMHFLARVLRQVKEAKEKNTKNHPNEYFRVTNKVSNKDMHIVFFIIGHFYIGHCY